MSRVDMNWLAKKSAAIVRKGPATLRNVVFSRFDIWPVGRLTNDELRTMPVYCISLKDEARRRQIMQAQVDAMGFQTFEFVDAFDGRKLTIEDLIQQGLYDDEVARREHGRTLSRAEIAGSLSHGAVYDLMLQRKQPRALILEDDALFLTGRLNRLNLRDVPADADVVFLNTFLHQTIPLQPVKGQVYSGDAYYGSAAAYIVTAPGAAKLAPDYKPVVCAADGFLGCVRPATPGHPQPFKHVGVTTKVTGYIIQPDCVLNGSVCYYYRTSIPSAKIKSVPTAHA